jgi:hypothetical protein
MAVAIGEVETGGVAVARDQAAAPEIDAGLDPGDLAGGARVGKGLVVVVDLLAEQAAPDGWPAVVVRDGGALVISGGALVMRVPSSGVAELPVASPFRQTASAAASPTRSCNVPSVVSPICRAIGCTTP